MRNYYWKKLSFAIRRMESGNWVDWARFNPPPVRKFSFCYSSDERSAPVSRTAETDSRLLASRVQRTRNKFQVYLFCLRQELFGELVGVRSIKPGEMKYGKRTNSLRRFSSSTVIYDYLSILSWLFQRTFSVPALRSISCNYAIDFASWRRRMTFIIY